MNLRPSGYEPDEHSDSKLPDISGTFGCSNLAGDTETCVLCSEAFTLSVLISCCAVGCLPSEGRFLCSEVSIRAVDLLCGFVQSFIFIPESLLPVEFWDLFCPLAAPIGFLEGDKFPACLSAEFGLIGRCELSLLV
ncbi:hypothetical protein [Bacillus sp. EB600]|uniref:hypothetical protein n=1 Tax=Bacillus sp. EB600 TaxID=2806345 RepID=UPI00210C17BC|nr:hypothetical protein [Bacillus sp. EB600]MCQ6283007.1 hypothetical protein [Bacillus sp. EB600]